MEIVYRLTPRRMARLVTEQVWSRLLLVAACCLFCFATATWAAATSEAVTGSSPTFLLASTRFLTTENAELAIPGIIPRANSSEVDPTALIEVTASATYGTLTLPTLDGMFVHGMSPLARARATVVSGSKISFSASESISQQAVAALKYSPGADWNGNDTLALSVGTKARHGGPLISSANASVLVQVSSANSKPLLVSSNSSVLDVVEDT